MQKKVIIRAKDGSKIYGVLDYLGQPKRLAILIHGLNGRVNQHLFFNGADFLKRHRFAVFRIDLYSGEPGGRHLEDCTIKIHSSDIDSAVEYFRRRYREILLVGASLGGPAVLESDLQAIAKIALWDPSHRRPKSQRKSWFSPGGKGKLWLRGGRTTYLVNKRLVDEWENLDYRKWVDNCRVPLKVICAGQGILKDGWRKLIKKFSGPAKLVIIPQAGHNFDEEGTEAALFKETLAWFDKGK